MNAYSIALQFMARDNRWLRSTIMPNFTPCDWWENDIFEITGASYWIEYEIKMSRSDYFADLKKEKQFWPEGGIKFDPVTKSYPTPPHIRKHDLLKAGDLRGPNRFYFLTPKDLIKPEEVPAWAGLIYARKTDSRYITFDRVTKAPLIHGQKLGEDHKHRRGVLRCCYGRIHSSIGHQQPICSMDHVPFLGPEGAD